TMTPYYSPVLGYLKHPVSFLFILIALGAPAYQAGSQPSQGNFDALTQSGFNHFYSLEYDQALRDFQSAREVRPDEPNAINHELEARLFQQLYKYNALDTRLYMKQRFLSGKQVPIDPVIKKRILELAEQAIAASDKRLKLNPRDVQALYTR